MYPMVSMYEEETSRDERHRGRERASEFATPHTACHQFVTIIAREHRDYVRAR
jgi:hypothetical protein